MDLQQLRRKSKAFQTQPTRSHSEVKSKRPEGSQHHKGRRKSSVAPKPAPCPAPPDPAAIVAQTRATANRLVAAAAGKDVGSPTHPGAHSGGVLSPSSLHESRLRGFAVAAVALTVVLATVSLLTLALWRRSAKTSSSAPCDTRGCQAFAEAYGKRMRRDVPPCSDFAEFVCGAYARKDESVRWKAYEAFRSDLVLPAHNDSLLSYKSQNTRQKAWVFYRNCEDVVTGDADNTKIVLGMMKEARLDWPARNALPDAVYSILYLQAKLAWPTPLEYSIKELDIGNVHVTFSPSADVEKYARDRRRRMDKRKDHADFFNALVQAFGNETGVAVDDDFEGTMQLEKEHMEAISGSPGAASGQAGTVMSDSGGGLAKRWHRSLAEVFSERLFSENTKVTFVATDQRWFERLLKHIVSNESNAVLMLGWRAAQEASQYGNRELALSYYRTEQHPLESYMVHCFDLFSDLMGLASIKDYVAAHFTKEIRDDVTHIAQMIRRIFFEKLTDSVYDWKNLSVLYSLLDSSQSPSLNEQFVLLPTLSNSFPENLRQIKVLLRDKPDLAAAIYAHHLSAELYSKKTYYFREHKDHSVAYAMLPLVLNFPYYEPDTPLAIRYGTLGTSLGSLTAEVFFAEAQKTATPPAIPAFLECAAHNGGRELAVPMAGISMAYKVFMEKMREASGTEKQLHLAGLEHLSPGQLFFFATVYQHCGSAELSMGNKMLRLISGFSEAYACAKASPMRAAKFCNQL